MKESSIMKVMNASLIRMEGGQNLRAWATGLGDFEAVEGERTINIINVLHEEGREETLRSLV